MRILHCGDIHIRNLKRHDEYREVFSKFYEKVKELNVDAIYVAGDLAHTKTQLSPEYFELASEFLSFLADIAPTIVIPGNHDGNLRSTKRQDAITPIVDALDHPNLVLLKNSQELKLKNGVVLNHLSVFDEDNWCEPSNPDAINIALYHGSISGCKTDSGWVMKEGENNISIFEEFDMAMLGDIHLSNQALDKEGRYRYCGSLIQQSFGETNDKGFLVWDIQGKDEFSVEHHMLENPNPFITIELDEEGKIPDDEEVPTNARLRLVSDFNLPLVTRNRALDVAKARFSPVSASYHNRGKKQRKELEEAKTISQEDTRDLAVQEKLIKEFLEDYKAGEDTLNKIFALNKKYNSAVEEKEDVSRNINWKLKSVSWDNLFNYGEDNHIDFDKLNGIVGIFGKNYSGKSSIIDSILFSLFNSTSKNERKNLNIINQNRDWAQGKINIEVGNKTYTIFRQCEKYTKKLKGKLTKEAKTDVEFTVTDNSTGEVEELNGTSRTDSDKNVRRVFGTLEDFLITSMSSQGGALAFINEGSTKRKELLAKFLDLEIFDKKFKMAKEEVSDLRGALKRAEGREFDNDIKEAQDSLLVNENKIFAQKNKCKSLEDNLTALQEELKEVESAIGTIPAEIINVRDLKNKLLNKQQRLEKAEGEIGANKLQIQEYTTKLQKARDFLKEFDIDSYKEKQEQIDEISSKLKKLAGDEKLLTNEIKTKQRKIQLLGEVPCGDQFKTCKFIKDAYRAKDAIVEDNNSLAKLNVDKGSFLTEIKSLNPTQVADYLQKHNMLLSKCDGWESSIEKLNLQIEKNTAVSKTLAGEIDSLKKEIAEYEKNKEAIENMQSLIEQKKGIISNIKLQEVNLEHCKSSILDLYKENGSLEQRIESLQADKAELESLRDEFSSYDLFMRCMHPNGISYDVIKRKLPVINEEIAKVLANVVNFEVFFEEDGKKLNILIKHPKYDARPLEMGSGAEKTIAAMAIRLALLSVSTLPKPDLFILDEPGTALDETNMEGFIRILDMVKSYFKTVLLISHLESLKDCVDKQITIERKDGYAYVNHTA
jgi:exonuclease SbcC